jgi:Ca2+-binding RTX toxin-like protein
MAEVINEKSVVRGNAASNNLRAVVNDTDGTYFVGNAGDDILRGGRYDDILFGGTGNDEMFGGLGADVFKFSNVFEAGDVDKIRDLNFADGDVIQFTAFASGTFADANGIDARADGTGAYIQSTAGLVALVNASASDGFYATQRGTSNTLVLHISNGSIEQTIELTGQWLSFVQAGGLGGGNELVI